MKAEFFHVGKYLSDTIPTETYENFKNDIIVIDCPTGYGKTTFLLDVYARYRLQQNPQTKILYLVNRTKLDDSIQRKIENLELDTYWIDVKTYQEIAYPQMLPKYDVIICDEAHFFLNDADFNPYTDIIYQWIMRQTNSTIFFISATIMETYDMLLGDYQKIKASGKDHFKGIGIFSIKKDYDYINQIYWFKARDWGYLLDDLLSRDEKSIFFVESIAQMKKIYEKYKDSNNDDFTFFTSRYTKNDFYYNVCLKQENKIHQQEDGSYTFDGKILITTRALDCGIDFKDPQIKNIASNVFDFISSLQCIGRRRISQGETINLYLQDYYPSEIQRRYEKSQNDFEELMMFKYDNQKWLKQYGWKRDNINHCLYPTPEGYQINSMRERKLIIDLDNLKLISGSSYKTEYLRYMLSAFNFTDEKYDRFRRNYNDVVITSNKSKKAAKKAEKAMNNSKLLADFLIFNEGKFLTDEEKQKLIELCSVKDDFGRIKKTIEPINDYLSQYGYTVTSKKKQIDGKRVNRWIINKK